MNWLTKLLNMLKRDKKKEGLALINEAMASFRCMRDDLLVGVSTLQDRVFENTAEVKRLENETRVLQEEMGKAENTANTLSGILGDIPASVEA